METTFKIKVTKVAPKEVKRESKTSFMKEISEAIERISKGVFLF